MSVISLDEWRKKREDISTSQSQSTPNTQSEPLGQTPTDEDLESLMAIWTTLARARQSPFTTKSDFARMAATEIGICASDGLISTKIGESCMFGGQVGVTGHITLGNNVKVAAQSGISKSVKENTNLQGSPAIELKEFYKAYAGFKNLPDILKRLNELERKVKGNE